MSRTGGDPAVGFSKQSNDEEIQMRNWRKTTVAVLATAGMVAVSACGAGSGDKDADNKATSVRIMVPNSPGGGYDTTARTAAKVMEDEELAKSVQVYNLEGAGGTVGLARTVQAKGDGDELMLMGLGVVGAVFTNKSESTLADTTPIARLISEPDVFVVPAKSPYKTLDDFVKAWKADTKGLAVGGGSAPGGPDHLAPHLFAQAVGIAPKDVNYASYDGGGPLLAGLLSGEIKMAAAGVSEYKDQIDAGQLRVLGVTSSDPVPGFDAPTLKEQGVDLEFINWRGLVAPPGIDKADKDALIDLVSQLHGTKGWEEAMKTNGWTDSFMTGDEFGDFIQSENDRVESVLSDLGLV